MNQTKTISRFSSAGTLVAILLCVLVASIVRQARADNPIVIGKGLADPQVRIYGERAWLYSTHDASPDSKGFRMNNWWIWSSTDLVNWTQENVLTPEETYFGKPSNDCWATDAISRNGKYYFYFSMGQTNIGVVVGDSPKGPWKDPLGKPLVPSTLTPTQERDPGIVVDAQGNAYIIFGVWDFYLARLNPDMISLAEAPRKIELDQKNGPYGPGKTDDKPFLHERDGKFYLSWGCYYAMSDNVYGPYVYKGSVIVKDRVAPEFQKALTYDRHGSFFELHHQWYFICNDQSWPGTQAHFRDSVISYIHYRDNGEIEPVYLDRVGVGRYDASQSRIEAENYFKASDMTQSQCAEGGFEMRDIHEGSSLEFPHVMHVPAGRPLSFRVASGNPRGGTIEVRADGPKGKLLGKCRVPNTGSWTAYQTIACKINDKSDDRDLYLLFRGGSGELLRLNWLSFIENKPSTAGVLEPDTR